MDKIAFLILAHDQPGHLMHLVSALSEGADIYIHVDAKSDISEFIGIAARPNVQLLRDRRRVAWGGFSVVEATLDLMRACAKSQETYAKIILLSGACYPVKAPAEIRAVLSADPSFNFISFAEIDSCDPFFGKRISRSWHMEMSFPYLKRLGHDALINRALRKAANVMLGGLRNVQAPACLDKGVYFGSQWWAISQACHQHVLNIADQHPEVLEFFRHAYAPDEIFFHSIIANSPYAENATGLRDVSHFEIEEPSDLHQVISALANIHYIDPDWSKTLGEEDFDTLIHSSALFARKFKFPISENLRQALQAQFVASKMELLVELEA